MTAGDVTLEVRPSFRGVLHRWTAPTFVVLTLVLLLRAHTWGDRLACLVYGLAVTAMLGVSAVYHSGRISAATARKLKRVDHSTILLAIAGTYTAVIGLALEGSTRTTLLVLTWVAAVAGMAIRLLWIDAPYPLVAVVYVVVGWLALVDLPAYVDALSAWQLFGVALGGVLYTVGAVVYALHQPNPWPATFGYHELFHLLVVLAAVANYAAIVSLVP
jgi:hemolysin III